jgi:hypothetical protein
MNREAMQMALEALEGLQTWSNGWLKFTDEIQALRQALETEQEPVLWLKTWSDGSVSVLKTKSDAFADHELEPLYKAPPKREWVGLHGSEVPDPYRYDVMFNEGWWWAEEKLKEKNHG